MNKKRIKILTPKKEQQKVLESEVYNPIFEKMLQVIEGISDEKIRHKLFDVCTSILISQYDRGYRNAYAIDTKFSRKILTEFSVVLGLSQYDESKFKKKIQKLRLEEIEMEYYPLSDLRGHNIVIRNTIRPDLKFILTSDGRDITKIELLYRRKDGSYGIHEVRKFSSTVLEKTLNIKVTTEYLFFENPLDNEIRLFLLRNFGMKIE